MYKYKRERGITYLTCWLILIILMVLTYTCYGQQIYGAYGYAPYGGYLNQGSGPNILYGGGGWYVAPTPRTYQHWRARFRNPLLDRKSYTLQDWEFDFNNYMRNLEAYHEWIHDSWMFAPDLGIEK